MSAGAFLSSFDGGLVVGDVARAAARRGAKVREQAVPRR
jgi:hypothetical protein